MDGEPGPDCVDGITETPTNPVDVRANAQVRARRLVLESSQVRVACLIGASEQQVADYEGGRVRIGAAALAEVVRALQTSVGYFFATINGPVTLISTRGDVC